MEKKLKLFVWENVLQHWGFGIIVAYAADVESARALARFQLSPPGGTPSEEDEADIAKEPRIIEGPEVFIVEGSE